jgi:ABC-type multidrug transport system ATPase subunit
MTGTGVPALRVDALSRSFGDREVLRDVTLRLERGERLALRGPNGSGKTTLLRCVTGALAPSSGSVGVCGHASGTLAARGRTGSTVAEPRAFAPGLTGRQSLRFTARVRIPSRHAAERAWPALVEELELEEIAGRRLEACSTGMLQQLAFAQALLGDPALLVLDEPTGSLDAAAAARLWGALDRRPAVAVLIASHRPEDAERCSRELRLTP